MSDKANLAEVNRTLGQWRNGVLTDVEVTLRLMAVIDEANIYEVMALVPADWTALIRKEIECRPRTDEEWSTFNPIRITGIAGPYCEVVERREKGWHLPPEEMQQLRAETDLFRRYFASLESKTV